jgi:hypothetical protein
LFAEAKVRFAQGEEWWPTVTWEEQHAKLEQAKYQETDSAWSDLLEDWLKGQGERIRTSTIFEFGIHVENVKDIRPTDYVRLDKVMKNLGWKKHRDKHGTLYVKGVA